MVVFLHLTDVLRTLISANHMHGAIQKVQCVVCFRMRQRRNCSISAFTQSLNDHENSDSVNTSEGEKVQTTQALLEGRKEGLGDP